MEKLIETWMSFPRSVARYGTFSRNPSARQLTPVKQKIRQLELEYDFLRISQLENSFG